MRRAVNAVWRLLVATLKAFWRWFTSSTATGAAAEYARTMAPAWHPRMPHWMIRLAFRGRSGRLRAKGRNV